MMGERAYWSFRGKFYARAVFPRGGRFGLGSFFRGGKSILVYFFRGRFYPGAVFPGGSSVRGETLCYNTGSWKAVSSGLSVVLIVMSNVWTESHIFVLTLYRDKLSRVVIKKNYLQTAIQLI